MSQKEVIYIDVEDDITTIIDKATKGSSSIVALVLPKKTPTLKSSVNMKLLKNSIDKAKKKTVLITGEDALLPLAGAAGMHVAGDLKSRPSIPKAPSARQSEHIISDETEATASDEKSEAVDAKNEVTTTKTTTKTKKVKTKSDSRIKVPNFDKFRLRIILGVLVLIGLIVGWYVMFRVMPKADIVLQAQTTKVSTNATFTLNAGATEADLEKGILPGEVKEIKKTLTERFTATGEKDNGQKASGTITVQNCDTSDDFTLPSGTTFTDSDSGFSFTSSAAVSVPGGSFNGGGCSVPGEADVAVIADESGDGKNLSPRTYSVSGVSSLITGFGGQMSGGTSDIITVVSETDISSATQTLLNKRDENIKSELAALFGDEAIVIDDTFTTVNSTPISSVAVDGEATEASVSSEFTYTVLGVKKDVLGSFLEKDQESQIDTASLSILENGVDEAAMSVDKKTDDTTYSINVKTDGFVGPELNVDSLKEEIAGKRFSEAIELLESKPGIQEAVVNLSPFWVFSAPGPDKTTITIEIPESQAPQN